MTLEEHLMKAIERFLLSGLSFAVLASVFVQLNTQPVYAPPPCQTLSPPNCGYCYCVSLGRGVYAPGCPESPCAF